VLFSRRERFQPIRSPLCCAHLGTGSFRLGGSVIDARTKAGGLVRFVPFRPAAETVDGTSCSRLASLT